MPAFRSIHHPHVRTIMSVLDRAIASPSDCVASVASMIITQSNCPDEFECFVRPKRDRWTNQGLRAVVLAYALNAPPSDLSLLVDAALGQKEWLDAFETRHEIESHDLSMEAVLAPSRVEAERIAYAEANS